jgi:N6-L-threonylcarbamoyladenine synthase
MLILGIESSCDDTSVALLESSDQGHFVIAQKTASQIDVHAKYGGVVPEIAGRMHAEKIVPLIEEVLKNQPTPDVIAVTAGPGLITGLIVGVEAAKTLAWVKNIPLVAVNHIDGHIHSVELQSPKSKVQSPTIDFPALILIVSGGHTELILMRDHGDYTILGATKDDAAGECFDKVAKLLGFPYPGGPHISKLGALGNISAIDFPRPMMTHGNFDFSFAGLKTSALYWSRDNKFSPEITINDFCASFEQAIVDVLIAKTIRAAKQYNVKTVILAGGVSANKKLRETLETSVNTKLADTKLKMASPEFCMDNGAMIAAAGYYLAKQKKFTDWRTISADPNWKIV